MKDPEDPQVSSKLVRHGVKDDEAVGAFRESPRYPYSLDDLDGEPGNGLGLRDYWFMVRQRWRLVAALTLLVTAFAVFYVNQQTDIYEAEASLQLDLETNPAIDAKDRSVIISQGTDSAYYNTQVILLKSPAFLRRVAKTLDLEHDDKFFSRRSAASNWGRIFQELGGRSRENSGNLPLRANVIAPATADADIAEAQRLEPYVNALRANLNVKPTEATRLISIRYRHSVPSVAARVANAIADTFVQANWERRAASTSSAGEFLQKRIAELQFKIAENEKRLIEYAKTHQVLPPDSGRDMQADRLASLDRGLLEAESARKLAEADYHAALPPGRAAAIVEASGNAQIAVLNSRLNELRHQRVVLLMETGENWPEVKVLNAQISALEAQLKDVQEKAVATVLTNLETRYRQALAREQSLRTSFNQQHRQTLSEDEAAISYRMIRQETQTYKGLLDNLLLRSKENDVLLAATPNNVHVTDYATLPIRLVGPARLWLVAGAFLVSLAAGVGLAILFGSFDKSQPVDSVERVERLFGLSSLAVIPSDLTSRKPLLLKRRNGHRIGLLLDQERPSPLAEAYRKLRTSVLRGSGGQIGTLLITSSLPAEGKTTTVINTGLMMAKSGLKVLLIDGDLRHPCLHELLSCSNDVGLTTILGAEVNNGETLKVITRYNESNLYVLPSGPIPDNPAELLESDQLTSLLQRLRRSFNHIIIDSPPISFFTDAVLLSTVVDGVLIVVRGPKTSTEMAKYSLQTLDAVGAPLLGVVLNDIKQPKSDYRYYTQYSREMDNKPDLPKNGQGASQLGI